MKKFHTLIAGLASALLLASPLAAKGSSGSSGKSINIYSSRHYDIDAELYDDFTLNTGIQVNIVAGNAGETVERAAIEGQNTQADVFFVTGADILYELKNNDVLGKLPEKILNRVPKNLADTDKTWVAFSKRARVIVYDKAKNPKPAVTSYEDLVTGSDKIAIRSSSNSYNRMLLASMIHANGEAVTRQWVRNLVGRLARQPQGNDRSQAKAVAAGLAEYAIMNTYYVGRMLRSKDPDEVKVGKSLGIIFPNQDSRGTHVNIAGLAISKYSQNKEEALALIDFLLSAGSQNRITNENFEYPAVRSVQINKLVASWGSFREDTADLNQIGAKVPLAAKIADEEGWK